MILESDALQIVQALKIDVPNKNKYGYLIQNTQKNTQPSTQVAGSYY